MSAKPILKRLLPISAPISVMCGLILGLSGCGVPSERTPIAVTVAPTSFSGAAPVVADSEEEDITLFFILNGRFVPVSRISSYPNNGGKTGLSESAVQEAINKLIDPNRGGLTSREIVQGLTSPLEAVISATAADGSLLTTIPQVVARLEAGIAYLDLSNIEGSLRRIPPVEASEAIAQLAYTTLLATSGVGGVRFESDDVTVLLVDPTSGGVFDELHLDDLGCLADATNCVIPSVSFQTVAEEPVIEADGKDPLQSE